MENEPERPLSFRELCALQVTGAEQEVVSGQQLEDIIPWPPHRGSETGSGNWARQLKYTMPSEVCHFRPLMNLQ